MDPQLLREREAFRKRAMALPVVEKHTMPSDSVDSKKEKHKAKKAKMKKRATSSVNPGLKSSIGSVSAQFKTKNKFAILKMAVDLLKARHRDGKVDEPLSLEEILKEIDYSDVAPSIRNWLPQAFRNNPKVTLADEDRYLFKPLYRVKNRGMLVNVLREHWREGLGGIKLADMRESYPKTDSMLSVLKDEIIALTRSDKEGVLFYNDPDLKIPVDEDFQKLWRSISIEGLTDTDIEKHLHTACEAEEAATQRQCQVAQRTLGRHGIAEGVHRRRSSERRR
ncbi:general transcription factor IIE subunit 2-like isoform X2 [Oscarella lobularis]|uniref:general transcription factor IIE subunit 2-like isoform X2 n=1 Tax=Oscarella lobularis TaxID=121494 RepID=UPI0033132D41